MPLGVTTLAQFNGADGLGEDTSTTQMYVGVGAIAILLGTMIFAGATARSLVANKRRRLRANKRRGRGLAMSKLRKFSGRFWYVVGTQGDDYEHGKPMLRYYRSVAPGQNYKTSLKTKAYRFEHRSTAQQVAKSLSRAHDPQLWVVREVAAPMWAKRHK